VLTTLRVRDLATIGEVSLDLGAGLNVLTGETGAGKSLLVDALALLLGDRADRAVVRPGAGRAVIEGVLDAVPPAAKALLEASGLDVDETLVIRRDITAEGRSRAWINGSPTTIGVLAAIGEALVDLHGQHQTIQLLDARMQRDLLDAYADSTADLVLVRSAHAALATLRAEQEALLARRDEARRRADWLRFVVEEIDAARLRPGEDDGLDLEAVRLAQAGTLAEQARNIVASVDDDETGARHAIARAERALHALERLDPDTGKWRELLDTAFAQLDELARLAEQYADGLSEDPERLAQVERRRDLLEALKRKHGATLSDVLRVRDSAHGELDLLDTADLDLRTVASNILGAERALTSVASALSDRRRKAADRLAREVSRLLPRLGLSGGEFTAALEPLPAVGTDGAEQVVFMVKLNQGMEPRPLAKVVSGGELSRLMLALKVVLARHDAVPTLVFDEVDQGIGGEVGTRVGEALSRAAERHQVLVITHLPQIAARADRHLRIAKATRQGLATSDVSVLHGEDRIEEVARMLGDADGDAARRLARALLSEVTA
jgi:DNA repair protein RecN (Recombination protein N)